MSQADDWSGMHKAEVRKLAMRNDGACSRYVSLPGVNCYDIHEGFSTGKLNLDTAIYGVERNHNISPQISQQLATFGNRHASLFEGDLNTFNLEEPADFAFFDLCDELTDDTILWLTTQQVKFTDGARVGFTFACFRTSAWYRRFAETVTKRHLFDMLSQDRPMIEARSTGTLSQSENERARLKLLLAGYSVKCALWKYQTRCSALLSYSDTYPMYFVEVEVRHLPKAREPHHPQVVQAIHDLHRQKRLQDWPHWFRVGNMIKEHYAYLGVPISNAYALERVVRGTSQIPSPRAKTPPR